MDLRTNLDQAVAGKRVLLTGHTGFKGAWLSVWLERLGASVHGLALEPPTDPSMFDLCGLDAVVDHTIGDVSEYEVVRDRIGSIAPDLVFHLAAQPLVRLSYEQPLLTWRSNVMGTAHVLEAVREGEFPCAVVVVSSDKCYENRNWVWGYRESDPLGGSDPYSASKGATELVVQSYRESFFAEHAPVRIASARAGNVIGGGDWAVDRLVPDCIRAFARGEPVTLRNPNSTRPWQHVLEPLSGYLMLAAELLNSRGESFCGGWNFGPATRDVRPVVELVAALASRWDANAMWGIAEGHQPKEALQLALNCDKAVHQLGWEPTWDFHTAVAHTVEWYRVWADGGGELLDLTRAQIEEFEGSFGRGGELRSNPGV